MAGKFFRDTAIAPAFPGHVPDPAFMTISAIHDGFHYNFSLTVHACRTYSLCVQVLGSFI